MAIQRWMTFGPSSGAPIAGFRKPTQTRDALVIRNDGRCEPRDRSIFREIDKETDRKLLNQRRSGWRLAAGH